MPRRPFTNSAMIHTFALQVLGDLYLTFSAPLFFYKWVVIVGHWNAL